MRAAIASTVAALMLVTTRLAAQQSVNDVSSAIASPVFPDIVAVERTVGDRHDLQFIRLSNQRPVPIRTVANAGEIDWRPVAEQGRSWFAYVASDGSGGRALMLNFIDVAGKLATSAPVRIPFAGLGGMPRWSRDGMHLAFVFDNSVLYIVADVASALASGDMSRLRPARMSAASTPAMFPAWSPSGDHIAYGTEVVSGGVRNGAIEVLPVTPATGEAAGVPIVVTGELGDDDEYRPSWSRDGKYVAFYAGKTSTERARRPTSIGIVEVVLNPRTGKGYRGIVKEGSQRWLADDVIADDMHGPAWTSIDETSERKDALVYVKRDAKLGDPIVVADFQRWLTQLPRNQYEQVMSSAYDAVSPGSVSSVEMNRKMRFVFTTLTGSSETVSYRDAAASWARGPGPTPPPVPVVARAATNPVVVTEKKPDPAIEIRSSRGQYVTRAILFPGFGQFSAGHRVKGSVLAVAGSAGAAYGIIGKLRMGAPLTEANAALAAINNDPSSRDAHTAAYAQAEAEYYSQRNRALLGAGVFAATWLIGILDAAMSSTPASNVSLKFAPDPSGRAGASTNIGFSIAVGNHSGGR